MVLTADLILKAYKYHIVANGHGLGYTSLQFSIIAGTSSTYQLAI